MYVCMQMMMLCKEIFEHFGLGQILFLRPYRIVSTGNSTGILQVTYIHLYIHIHAYTHTHILTCAYTYYIHTYIQT